MKIGFVWFMDRVHSKLNETRIELIRAVDNVEFMRVILLLRRDGKRRSFS